MLMGTNANAKEEKEEREERRGKEWLVHVKAAG